jgi:chromosome partitioning protein
MPIYIAVVNQKGGVGKTSTCVNLGAALVRQGFSVMAVDADHQKSMTDWMLIRDPSGFPFPVMEMSHPQLHRKLPEIVGGSSYDFVLVDCPPGGEGKEKAESVSRSAVMLADIVLVPLKPEPLDFMATGQLKSLLRDISVFKPDMVTAVVINCRETVGNMSDEARDSAADYLVEDGINLKVLKAEIYKRVVIAKSVIDGVTVFDFKPKPKYARESVQKAIEEYLALAKEVLECLNLQVPSEVCPDLVEA